MSSFSSSMMRCGSRLTRYQYRESRASTPAKASAETAAPPTWSSRSSSVTRLPACARYAAATRPLCPPPTMTTSTVLWSMLLIVRSRMAAAPADAVRPAASTDGSREVFVEIVHHHAFALAEEERVAIRSAVERPGNEAFADLDHHFDVQHEFGARQHLEFLDEQFTHGAGKHSLIARASAARILREGVAEANPPETRLVTEEVCVGSDGCNDGVLPLDCAGEEFPAPFDVALEVSRCECQGDGVDVCEVTVDGRAGHSRTPRDECCGQGAVPQFVDERGRRVEDQLDSLGTAVLPGAVSFRRSAASHRITSRAPFWPVCLPRRSSIC